MREDKPSCTNNKTVLTNMYTRYRKKTDEEIKTERKIQKGQERRLKNKNKTSMLLQENDDDDDQPNAQIVEMDVDEDIPGPDT
jgi:hypothetical protein